MSRSKRFPIVRIKAEGNNKAKLSRQVRRATNNALRSQELDEELELPNSKTIVQDSTYCDKTVDADHNRK